MTLRVLVLTMAVLLSACASDKPSQPHAVAGPYVEVGPGWSP